MILVDNRAGSKELFSLFPRGRAKLTRLEYGDFAFTGNGPDGVPWLVGIERKTIGDLVSCIGSGRMSGNQLEGLVNAYNTVYVVVEGMFRAGDTGVLEVWGRGQWRQWDRGRLFMLRDVHLFLHTLENVVGLKTWRTRTKVETVEWISSLYQWWTVKEWDEHHAHQQPHTSLSPDLAPHSLVRRVAAQLKGVGWGRAKAIDQAVMNVSQMCGMSEGEWESIEGIGEGLSKSIVGELRGIK